jgi:DNA repair exonuclease SbcCD ATPase subunit
MIKDL